MTAASPYEVATRAVGRFRLSVLTSDPGWVRLRLAVRSVLTIGLVCVAFVLLHRWFPMPAPAYAIGMLTAIQGAVSIKDPTVAGRAVTRIYAALCGFAVIAAISLVDHSLLRVNILLLAVIFLAVYARRFGTRWQGVGAFTFMCGVIGAFLKAPDTDLTDIAIALVLSGFIAHFVRNFVLPDRPAQDFERALRASLLLSSRLQAGIARSIDLGTPIDRRETVALARRAQEAVFLCESDLPAASNAVDADQAGMLAMRLFDLRLAIERTLDAALRDGQATPGFVPTVLQDRLSDLRDVEAQVRARAGAVGSFLPAPAGGGAQPATVPILPPRGALLADKDVRQAVQVTLASAIAMTAGLALSPERWFWAVLTAYLIFMNTQSRGAVAVRGLNRALGTAAGVCAGVGLAVLVHGNIYWTVPLATIAIFAAFYVMTLSYAVATFFITIALSLIYGLLGEFTPDLLVLRLEETLVGAFAGIFVSLAVLPLSTRRLARQAFDRFLSALDDLLADLLREGGAPGGSGAATSVTALDAARASFVDTASPMQSAFSFGPAHRWSSSALIQASNLAYAAHLLVSRFRETRPDDGERQALARIRSRLADPSERGGPASDSRSPRKDGPLPAADPASNDIAAYAIGLIDKVLDEDNPSTPPATPR